MDQINKEMQVIAVEKVLEEMRRAEEIVMKWNASWYEQLLNAHCVSLHSEIGEFDVRKMEKNMNLDIN